MLKTKHRIKEDCWKLEGFKPYVFDDVDYIERPVIGHSDSKTLDHTAYLSVRYNEPFEVVVPFIPARVTEKIGDATYSLHPSLKHIFDEIKESAKMLELSDNWDSEGALKINKTTWQNATSFLLSYSSHILNSLKTVISEPDIAPVADGSIDFTWHNATARLLLNFKTDNQNVAFYGDDYSGSFFIKGNISVHGITDSFLGTLSMFKK